MATPLASVAIAGSSGDTLSDASLYDAMLVGQNLAATNALLLGFAPSGQTARPSTVRVTPSNVSILAGALFVSSNVGVGTTTPAYPLDVYGNARFSSNVYGLGWSNVGGVTYAASLVTASGSGSGAGGTASSVSWPAWSSNGTNMYVTSNVGMGGMTAPQYQLHVSGTICTTNDVITQSDERIKTGLSNISDALDRVLGIRGYTYAILDEAAVGIDRRHAGVIAQDVMRVMPELVSEDPSSGVLSVSYGNMAALFVEAIRTLDTRLAATEALLQASTGVTGRSA